MIAKSLHQQLNTRNSEQIHLKKNRNCSIENHNDFLIGPNIVIQSILYIKVLLST